MLAVRLRIGSSLGRQAALTTCMLSLGNAPATKKLHRTAGSSSGGLYTLHCQAALQRYACVRAHEGNIHDMRPMGDGVLSLSSDRWRYHSAGGVPKVTFMDSQVRQQSAAS